MLRRRRACPALCLAARLPWVSHLAALGLGVLDGSMGWGQGWGLLCSFVAKLQ